MIDACDGEYSAICTLPARHGGDHNFVDTMGMCPVDNCRATAHGWKFPTGNNRPHNHGREN